MHLRNHGQSPFSPTKAPWNLREPTLAARPTLCNPCDSHTGSANVECVKVRDINWISLDCGATGRMAAWAMPSGYRARNCTLKLKCGDATCELQRFFYREAR